MCTISTVPGQGEFIITFNRDEVPARKNYQFPYTENINNKVIVYAKDSFAGGSWFAADNKGNVAVLFNGGFEAHKKLAQYRMSRGQILVNFIAATSPRNYAGDMNLTEIEPFSILYYKTGELIRITWSGKDKTISMLDASKPGIFSSSTLYSKEVQEKREHWLQHFLQEYPPRPECLFQFHSCYQSEDKENGMVVEKSNGCRTLSISQLIIQPRKTIINHLDILGNQKIITEINHHNSC